MEKDNDKYIYSITEMLHVLEIAVLQIVRFL